MFLIRTTFIVIALAATLPGAWAQEGQAHPETGRVPAHMLPAERAGILLSAGRDQLERPETTLDLMGLEDGDLVVDMGCGNGYYTLRVAKRIAPHGHVLAVDVQQGMLDQLAERMREAEIRNIYPILGDFDDPYLPHGKVDWMLLTDVYHEFSNPQAMLAKIRKSLAPDGKVALLEYRAEQDPKTLGFPIPNDHKMSVDEVLREWIPAGFRLVQRIETLPAQHTFFFGLADESEDTGFEAVLVGESLKATSTGNGRYYFAGQPSESDLQLFAHQGVKTVINLRTAPEVEGLGFDERAAVEAAGMAYTHVPMGRALPSDADLDTIFDELDGAEDGSVLLHCASSNRVGAVWAMYQLRRGGLSIDDAVADGKSAGMRAELFVDAVRAAN